MTICFTQFLWSSEITAFVTLCCQLQTEICSDFAKASGFCSGAGIGFFSGNGSRVLVT
jgi:hypothetical protein